MSGSLSRLRNIALVVFAVLIVSAASMWSLARYQQTKFEKLAESVSRLKAYDSPFDQAEEILTRYKQHATVEDQPCTASSCKFTIVLKNFLVDNHVPVRTRWFDSKLLRLFGVRPAAVVARAAIKDGTVQESELAAAYESTRGAWIWASWSSVVHLSLASKCENLALGRESSYMVTTGHTNQSNMHGPYVSATFEPSINDSERARCQYIRFDCMTSLIECANNGSVGARKFMPRVEQDIADTETIRQVHPEQYSDAVHRCLYGTQKIK